MPIKHLPCAPACSRNYPISQSCGSSTMHTIMQIRVSRSFSSCPHWGKQIRDFGCDMAAGARQAALSFSGTNDLLRFSGTSPRRSRDDAKNKKHTRSEQESCGRKAFCLWERSERNGQTGWSWQKRYSNLDNHSSPYNRGEEKNISEWAAQHGRATRKSRLVQHVSTKNIDLKLTWEQIHQN